MFVETRKQWNEQPKNVFIYSNGHSMVNGRNIAKITIDSHVFDDDVSNNVHMKYNHRENVQLTQCALHSLTADVIIIECFFFCCKTI